MARFASEGNVKIYYIPAVASLAAPTVAEIGAGVNITPFLPTGGVEINWTQNNATLPMMDESFVVSAIGTESAEITLTGTRDDTTDTFWTTFVRGANAFLLVSRSGAAIATSKVEVYPVQSHRPVPLAPAENEFQQASVTFGVTATPNLLAVVAA